MSTITIAKSVPASLRRHATARTPGYNTLDAKSATFECDVCHKSAFVSFPYGITPEKRSSLIQAALSEHRAIACTGTSEEGRVYRMWVPGR
jgi:hypothetical protein